MCHLPHLREGNSKSHSAPPLVWCHVSLIRCQVPCVRCQVLHVRCPVSPVRSQASCDNGHKTERVKEIATFPPTSHVSCVFCIFLGVQCQVSGLGVRCHLSSVRCQVSSLWCQVSPVDYHLSEKAKARATDLPSSQVSCVTCHVSGIMRQVSCVRCHMSAITCHVSCVRCHMSRIMCHMSFIVFS